MRIAGIFALALFGSLPACKSRTPAAPPTEPAPKVQAAKADTSPRALALQKLVGDGPIEKKIADLQRSAERNPNKVEFWVLLGRAWVQKAREASDPGFYVNANACADVALQVSPDDRLAIDLRGLVLLNDHRFAEARELAAKGVEKNPDDAMAWGVLSDALLELGRFDEAASAAQNMMDIKPNLPSYSRASYFRWLQGDENAALRYARLAIDSGRDPKDPEPGAWELVQAAMIFWHRGDYEGADAGFLKALDAMTEYPPALVGRGRVAMARGDGRRAAELFKRAYDQSPLPETAWLLGDARDAAGDRTGAEEAWSMVEKDGRRTDPRTLALFWATKNVHGEEALTLAREERAKRGDVYTLDAEAWALYRTGKITEARNVIDEARRHGTDDARLVYHQGAIHILAGDVARGKKLVADALARNPKFDATAEAEARALLQTTNTKT
jgi:tetratricopeptide (TPR) repeat protein